jgi:hypothetical protein
MGPIRLGFRARWGGEAGFEVRGASGPGEEEVIPAPTISKADHRYNMREIEWYRKEQKAKQEKAADDGSFALGRMKPVTSIMRVRLWPKSKSPKSSGS